MIQSGYLKNLNSVLFRSTFQNFLCDAIIVTKDGDELHAHSLFLAGVSLKLKAAMRSLTRLNKNKNRLRIHLSQSTSKFAKEMLEFIYTGNITPSYVNKPAEDFFQLLKVAHNLCLDDNVLATLIRYLQREGFMCLWFVQKPVSVVVDVVEYADGFPMKTSVMESTLVTSSLLNIDDLLSNKKNVDDIDVSVYSDVSKNDFTKLLSKANLVSKNFSDKGAVETDVVKCLVNGASNNTDSSSESNQSPLKDDANIDNQACNKDVINSKQIFNKSTGKFSEQIVNNSSKVGTSVGNITRICLENKTSNADVKDVENDNDAEDDGLMEVSDECGEDYSSINEQTVFSDDDGDFERLSFEEKQDDKSMSSEDSEVDTSRLKEGLNMYKFELEKCYRPIYFCKTCNKVFSKEEYDGHKAVERIEKPFKCEVCSHLYSNRADLQDHLDTHDNIIKLKGCVKRNSMFNKIVGKLSNEETVGNYGKQSSIGTVNKSASEQDANHSFVSKDQSNKIQNEVEDMSSVDKNAVTAPFADDNNPNVCNFSDKTSDSSQVELTKLLPTPSKKQRVKTACVPPSDVINLYDPVDKLRLVEGNNFCRYKEGGRVRQCYVCTKCNRHFDRANYYDEHKITESGMRPFNCPLCSQSFSRTRNMINHMLLHRGIRKNIPDLKKSIGKSPMQYGCFACKKIFDNKTELSSHWCGSIEPACITQEGCVATAASNEDDDDDDDDVEEEEEEEEEDSEMVETTTNTTSTTATTSTASTGAMNISTATTTNAVLQTIEDSNNDRADIDANSDCGGGEDSDEGCSSNFKSNPVTKTFTSKSYGVSIVYDHDKDCCDDADNVQVPGSPTVDTIEIDDDEEDGNCNGNAITNEKNYVETNNGQSHGTSDDVGTSARAIGANHVNSCNFPQTHNDRFATDDINNEDLIKEVVNTTTTATTASFTASINNNKIYDISNSNLDGKINQKHNGENSSSSSTSSTNNNTSNKTQVHSGNDNVNNNSSNSYNDKTSSSGGRNPGDNKDGDDDDDDGGSDENNQKFYRCSVCHKRFLFKQTLINHIKVSHKNDDSKKTEERNQHMCAMCGESFKHRQDLILHEKSHGGEEMYYQCDVCLNTYTRLDELNEHKLKHTYNADGVNSSSVAKRNSSNNENFREANTLSSSSKKKIEFVLNLDVFKNSKSFDGTINTHYSLADISSNSASTIPGPYNPPPIIDDFTSNSQLVEGLNLIMNHAKGKPYSKFYCVQCNKTFTRASVYEEHLRVHTGVRPFCCEICGKTFLRESNLCGHMVTHREKQKFNCKICKRKFAIKQKLLLHELEHDREEPFKCTICPMRFIRETDLKEHGRVHDVNSNEIIEAELQPPQQQQPQYLEQATIEEPILDENIVLADIPSYTTEQIIYDAVDGFIIPSDPHNVEITHAMYPHTSNPVATLNILEVPNDGNVVSNNMSVCKSETDAATEAIAEDGDLDEESLKNISIVGSKESSKIFPSSIKLENGNVIDMTYSKRIVNMVERVLKVYTGNDNPSTDVKKIKSEKPEHPQHSLAAHRTLLRQQEMRPIIDEQTHYLTPGGRVRPYIFCEICSQPYKFMREYEDHMRIHTGHKPFCCELCGKTFHRAKNLSTHRYAHVKEKKFKCEVCGRAFALGTRLKMHLRIHTGEKPYECDICHEKFIRRNDYMDHRRHKHTGGNTCLYCGKKYSKLESMREHINDVHRNIKPIKCKLCQESFSYSVALYRHMKKHKGQDKDLNKKIHHCKFCTKSFPRPCLLDRHMWKAHTSSESRVVKSEDE